MNGSWTKILSYYDFYFTTIIQINTNGIYILYIKREREREQKKKKRRRRRNHDTILSSKIRGSLFSFAKQKE